MIPPGSSAGHGGEIMANQDKQSDQNSGRGQVKDPKHDARLKENGGGQQGQGQVKDPKNDDRLKDNRDR
jgi:hypothetical protein